MRFQKQRNVSSDIFEIWAWINSGSTALSLILNSTIGFLKYGLIFSDIL